MSHSPSNQVAGKYVMFGGTRTSKILSLRTVRTSLVICPRKISIISNARWVLRSLNEILSFSI